ncbi:MAG: hypothetical protein JW934_17820 [Anaerolineae bacterium]|nr:hypothetical protein [Anaerolineae bacterium]
MAINDGTLNWLLEDNNPGVRVRALSGLCGLSPDHEEVQAARRLVVQTLDAARDLSWVDLKGLWLIYHLTALAESGLSWDDVPVDPVVNRLLSLPFDASCGDMMALRALAMLGYADDGRVQERLAQLAETQLPDGGWLCLHRVHKGGKLGRLGKTPKSCIKAAMHGLLLAGELEKRGLSFAGSGPLIGYFLKRRLFYRTDDPTRLVLDCRPGWRMTDVFFPAEVQRVGLPMLLDALAALGAGSAEELQDAWRLLDDKRDVQGRVVLEGALAKSYLPKERVGKPSKWGTLYACLAWEHKDVQ